jgi:hypothetical protein
MMDIMSDLGKDSQEETLFKDAEKNLIVSTAVVEEGIDICFYRCLFPNSPFFDPSAIPLF